VKVLFQPAEESPPGGAKPMIDAGVLEDPKVDAALGLHIDQDNPVGVIELRPGPAMAAADRFHMVIRGKGGHGAKPHDTVDPIVIGAQIVTALQTLAARVVDPTEEVVVTVSAPSKPGSHSMSSPTPPSWAGPCALLMPRTGTCSRSG